MRKSFRQGFWSAGHLLSGFVRAVALSVPVAMAGGVLMSVVSFPLYLLGSGIGMALVAAINTGVFTAGLMWWALLPGCIGWEFPRASPRPLAIVGCVVGVVAYQVWEWVLQTTGQGPPPHEEGIFELFMYAWETLVAALVGITSALMGQKLREKPKRRRLGANKSASRKSHRPRHRPRTRQDV